jgi:mycofactocin precursor
MTGNQNSAAALDTVSTPTVEAVTATPVVADALLEDVSIDGMCGVY